MGSANTVYFITHPSYSAIARKETGERASIAQLRVYFQSRIVPLIKQLQSDPEAVVVLVRTPKTLAGENPADFEKTFPNHNFRKAVQAGIEEDKFEKFLQRMLKNRAIVARQQFFSSDKKTFTPRKEELIEGLKKELKKRKITIERKAQLRYFGAWGEACAFNYATDFWEAVGRAREIFGHEVEKARVVRRKIFNERPIESLTIFGNRDFKWFKKIGKPAGKKGWQAPRLQRPKIR